MFDNNFKKDDIICYIENRLVELNTYATDYYDISITDNSSIFYGWIDMNTIYLPFGSKAMGFKLDRQAIIDFAYYFKENMSNGDISYEDSIDIINKYLSLYFGNNSTEKISKKFYKYGHDNSIGKLYRLSQLKDKDVAGILEKAALENALFNYIGFESSLVISNANGVNHAYCLIHEVDGYKVVDPSYLGNPSLSCVFQLDLLNKKCIFDPSIYGKEDIKVVYNFPFEKLEGCKKKIKK